ncbi:ATP-dependent DNA ligase [Microbacterium pumilum]|uniref:DUF7882 domain-containing protein n=1 Tax=Microbacterium pumilum TaxID=344165 RepID=A0ABN2RRC6_9MICO
MGKFIYGAVVNTFDVDDRTLAHLRVVIMNKLRRSESFMFDLTMSDGSGSRSFWMGPSIPIQFQFFGGRNPRINRAWVEELMGAANGPRGLWITPEPAEPVSARSELLRA